MELTYFKLAVRIDPLPGAIIVLENVSPDETVAGLIRQLLQRMGLPVEEQGWCLAFQSSFLRWDGRLRHCLPTTEESVELVLLRIATPTAMTSPPASGDSPEIGLGEFHIGGLDEPAGAEGAGTEPTVADDVAALESEDSDDLALLESEDLDLALDEEDAAACEDAAETAEPIAKPRQVATRRATIRYYNRMNPERVYPLLVLITRDMIEKIRKENTDQRSSRPFPVDIETPVEIEPVLPGCDCYPPKIVTRLGSGDLTANFHVVPRLLGRVEGASVTIRQEHGALADIALDIKIVQRTWVILSATMTFVLPGVSAILKHFGITFDGQNEQGFSLYLAFARLVFDQVSPLVLTIGLGLGTGLLWWFIRPRRRDLFWKIEKLGPEEKLRRIAAAMESAPEQASHDLMELLKAYPDYQPARLFYAEWHANTQNFQAALTGYHRAFKLGVTKGRHYLKASFAASKIGQNETALRILQEAERLLPAGEMTGIMLYNMGCYHVRLGDSDRAMGYLQRAVAAGYTKEAQYLKDPDLAPVRTRRDFQRLIAFIRAKSAET